MGSIGRQRSNESSVFTTKTVPGATGELGYGTSTDLFNQSRGLASGNAPSVFSQPLEQALLNPNFIQNDVSQNLLNQLMDQTAARGAVSGFGAPTQSALAASIAPTMVNLRNQQIEGLQGAKAQDIQQWMAQMQALLELTGLAMPQTIAGNTGQGSSSGWSFGISGGK